MHRKFRLLASLALTVALFFAGMLTARTSAEQAPITYEPNVSAWDLIAAMNSLRMSYGLPALIEDPIINAVAQNTAQIMADSLLSWHIGDVPGRLSAAGYGGGAKVYATENFAVGYGISIDEIMVYWSDASHMLPAVKAYYCNVGAGVAKAANGSTYYILQAAYVSGKECGTYTTPGGGTQTPPNGTGFVPGIITPVKVATPDASGKIIHEVQPGQSFWSIAIAYQVSIKDILQWNNLPEGTALQIGDSLFIPGPETAGYSTPTPVGFFEPAAPDSNGRVVHTVAAYQNLSLISSAYSVGIERILSLNGLSLETPLQIGQKLLIDPGKVTETPTLTITPTPLSPIQRLTPADDGKYYHTVGEGQNFTWIAEYYGIALEDLLAWNNLTENYPLWAGERLLLNITPPATATSTPLPASATPLPTATTALPTATPSLLPSATTELVQSGENGGENTIWLFAGGGALLSALVIAIVSKKTKEKPTTNPTEES